jgi:hypothetical protein
MASRLVRTNPVTVNEVLDGHTLVEIDCVDRLYLSLSVPNLMVGGQVVSFLTQHEGKPVPSPTLLDRRGQAFRREVLSFAEANDIPVISFTGKRDKRRPGVLAESREIRDELQRLVPDDQDELAAADAGDASEVDPEPSAPNVPSLNPSALGHDDVAQQQRPAMAYRSHPEFGGQVAPLMGG